MAPVSGRVEILKKLLTLSGRPGVPGEVSCESEGGGHDIGHIVN